MINFWLTGQKGNEITMASTSQMLNQQTRKWDKEFLEKLAIPTDMLGELWEPGHHVGSVIGGAQEKLGAKIYLFTRWVLHDTASAVAGVPATGGQDFAYLSSGTWSLMGVELPIHCATRKVQT